jgi:EPS-associated MarR family transcriptional regulator
MSTSDAEIQYRAMRLIEANPGKSQRELARELSISLGKLNNCIQALVRQRWLRVAHFKNSQNKPVYMYLLTRRGSQEKNRLALQFLTQKITEYEKLGIEIEQMRREAQGRTSS